MDVLNFINSNIILISLVFILNFLFLFTIYFSSLLPNSSIRDFIYTPIEDKKLLLLGGSGMAISNLILIHFIYSSHLVNTNLKFSALGYCVGIFTLTIQGFLDDKFNLSIKGKALGFIFTIITYDVLLHLASPIENIFFFVLHSFFWGLGTFFGSYIFNTVKEVSTKTSFIIFAFYFFISYHFKIFHLSYTSAALLLPIICYCLFNYFKKKILLGQIGSNILAIGYLFLSTQIYLNLSKIIGHTHAIYVVIIPLSIPTAEALFSLIYFSMLKRDHQLHHHENFFSEKNIQMKRQSSSLIYFIALLSSFLLIRSLNSDTKYTLALLSCLTILFGFYIMQIKVVLTARNTVLP